MRTQSLDKEEILSWPEFTAELGRRALNS